MSNFTMEKVYDSLLEKLKSNLPSIADEELVDIGIDLQPLDIRTGATPPSVTSYFLPRTDFPDVVDSPDLEKSPLLEFGSWSERPGREHPMILESFEMAMFPEVMTEDYLYHVFPDDSSRKEFYKESVNLS